MDNPTKTGNAPGPEKDNLWSALGSRIGLATQAPIPRCAAGNEAPLSSAQQQLWVIHQTAPQGAAYNLSFAWHLWGPLHQNALEQSLNGLVQRHETLRTVVLERGNEPVQRVVPLDAFKLRLVRMDALTEGDREAQALQWVQQESRRPFDLTQAPLLRAVLLRLEPERHILLLVLHHIACDGVSLGILLRELELLYAGFAQGQAPALPELPIRYADYALWERQFQKSAAFQAQLEYWRKQLEGKLPVLELPTDYPRPARFSSRGALWAFALPPELAMALRAFRSQEEATSFQVLLAAFQALLYRYTGQEDLIVGAPTAHRTRSEVRPLVGYFVNPQAIRTQVNGDLSFRELLRRVKRASLEAFANQDVPFHELVEVLKPERDPSSTPVFQAMFSFQSLPRRPLALAGLQVRRIEIDNGSAMFDLTLDLNESAEGIVGSFNYCTDLFEEVTVARMAGHLQRLLESALANPDLPLEQLPLLLPEERVQVMEHWNATTAKWPIDNAYPLLFEEQVNRTPSAPAVAYKDTQLSYAELNRLANQLACYLQQLGVGPDDLVGVCQERSPAFAVSVLAIFKAGAAYLPLDPANPPEHLAQILADAQPPVLLTQRQFVSRLPAVNTKLICLDDPGLIDGLAKAPQHNPENMASGDNLAYLLFTSGSTGRRKGVQITHRSLLNHNLAMAQVFQLQAADRVLQFSALSFDISVEEMFPTWLTGGCLVFRTEEALQSMEAFLEFVQTERITVLNLPTAFWHELVNGLESQPLPQCVRLVVIGGEKASPEKYRSWKQHVPASVQLVNSYGPTETTVTATLYVAGSSAHCEDLPIGRPIANVQVYVLDKLLQPVPVGVPGELYIGGAGVARGYHKRPELTAEKFVPDPFCGQPGRRLYRTGDLVRYRPDGNLEFLGRLDHQVKLRGFRIELGEIESVLLRHPQVSEAVVNAIGDSSRDKKLVACYVPRSPAPAVGELRQFLKEKLPAYMVPAAFVMLEKLPLTPNGKVDRKALPAPPEQAQTAERVLPRTPTEIKLAQIWCEVLGLKQVGIHDNYFDLGGHSLKAVWLFQKIKQVFGKNLPMVTLFQAPTIAQLAEVIAREHSTPSWSSLVPIKASGSRPPFYCVHGVGGNILEFLDLVKHMDEDQPFYGLQAVGLDGKRPRLHSISEMAAVYIAEIKAFQPEGPYYLGGSSFGGMVAYEMAQQLRAQGERVGLLAFFDTWAPGHPQPLPSTSRLKRRLHYWQYRVQLHWSNLMLLDTAGERWGYVRTKLRKWQRGKLTQWTELKQRWRQRWEEYRLPPEIRKTRQSGNRVADIYVPVPYPGKVTLFRATEQFWGIIPDPLRGWGELVQGGIEAYDIPGHHGAIMREPRVKKLAAQFKESLRKAQQHDAQICK